VDVGRTKIYLLDSNDPANPPLHRGITSEFYGGGAELRLAQEMVLGMSTRANILHDSLQLPALLRLRSTLSPTSSIPTR
jgi:glucan phosphorylase